MLCCAQSSMKIKDNLFWKKNQQQHNGKQPNPTPHHQDRQKTNDHPADGRTVESLKNARMAKLHALRVKADMCKKTGMLLVSKSLQLTAACASMISICPMP